jgi:hypothetical protein
LNKHRRLLLSLRSLPLEGGEWYWRVSGFTGNQRWWVVTLIGYARILPMALGFLIAYGIAKYISPLVRGSDAWEISLVVVIIAIPILWAGWCFTRLNSYLYYFLLIWQKRRANGILVRPTSPK